MDEYKIEFFWDDEAKVWAAVCDEIPLALESDSLDNLIERVKKAAPEITPRRRCRKDQSLEVPEIKAFPGKMKSYPFYQRKSTIMVDDTRLELAKQPVICCYPIPF